MLDIHQKNITYLFDFLKSKKIKGLVLSQNFSVSYFKSGAGTHLYLITNGEYKYLARINYYPLKNDWGVKEQEYKILCMIEPLKIAPKVYYFNKSNSLKQHFTIVDFVEGKAWNKIRDNHIINLAKILKRLHSSNSFKKFGDTFPPKEPLPYKCDIYITYANGEDKQIEKYGNLEGLNKVIEPYNRIKNKLGLYFDKLICFEGIKQFCLVHGDLKKENVIDAGNKLVLIDWECGGSDIPEADIGNLFAGCRLTKKQRDLFLKIYYGQVPSKIILDRIYAIKKVLDFFGIIDDYILQKRKKWNADVVRRELLKFERVNLK